jgi:hypothetical protein
MAGEAWRSLIPEEKADSEAAGTRSEPDCCVLFIVLLGLAVAVGVAIGMWAAK